MSLRKWVLPLVVVHFGCVVQSDPVPGPAGPQGQPGAPGKDGAPDNATLVALQAKIDELQAKVDALEAQRMAPDCPSGYIKTDQPPAAFLPDAVVCARGADEIVRVGTGTTAFWIDRYEASTWTTPGGPADGMQKFAGNDDSTTAFPKNGQFTTPHFALSVADVVPSLSITWFQAMEACAAAGKQLPTGQQWLLAARNSADPGSSGGDAANPKCNTSSGVVRHTAHSLGGSLDISCTSEWGAEDMIGNVSEWTAEWYAGLAPGGAATDWPDLPDATFSHDGLENLSGSVAPGSGLPYTEGLPAAAIRGGGVISGESAGIFALDLRLAPSYSGNQVGFRCVTFR